MGFLILEYSGGELVVVLDRVKQFWYCPRPAYDSSRCGILSRDAKDSGIEGSGIKIPTEHRGYADIQLRPTYVDDAPLCIRASTSSGHFQANRP